jgi:acetyl esterase/lipase
MVMVTRRTVLASAALAPVVAAAGTVPARARALPIVPLARSETIDIAKGIAYGEVDGEQLLLDVYRPPERADPRPAVLVFHPGGFTDGDRIWMDEFARGLAEAGYVAFTVGYRLFAESDGRNQWPAPLDDAQRAVRWVRANAEEYGVDPVRIGALGYSTGGLLAAHLGARDTRDNGDTDLADYSSRVACVVAIGADTDATIPWPNQGDTDLYAALLGGTPEEVPDAYRDFSVLTHIDGESAPVLVLHSPQDTWVPVEHSRRLVEALHAAEVEVVYAELADITHTSWTWANAGPWALAFLDRQLHPAR